MVFDCHCHTRVGSFDARVRLEDTIKILKIKGYDGLIVTDHNSYKGYDSLKEYPDDFVVLRGIEYDSMDGGHLIIILPTRIKYHIFEYRGMYVGDVINIVHSLGGIVGPAHPYKYNKLGFCHTKNKNNAEIIKQFDFIETFNGCLDSKNSILSDKLAEEYNKPCFGGSDSHSIIKVGLGKTIIPEDVYSEDDLIRVVKEANYSSFEATGTYFYRKYQKLHNVETEVGGFIYAKMNRLLSGNIKKRARVFEEIFRD